MYDISVINQEKSQVFWGIKSNIEGKQLGNFLKNLFKCQEFQ